MTTLKQVRLFKVPRSVAAETEGAVRAAGAEGYERFVLWTGKVDGASFTAAAAYVPAQTAYKLDTGLCVRVGGDELHRLNRWLYETGQTLGVQVHTHPSEAYHSDTDDAFPIVTQLGGLSIVLPDFGIHGFTGPGVATYRLTSTGWHRLSAPRAARLLQVI